MKHDLTNYVPENARPQPWNINEDYEFARAERFKATANYLDRVREEGNFTDLQLFERYLKVGCAIGYKPDFEVVLTDANSETLVAKGVVTKSHSQPRTWFFPGEIVTIDPLGNNIWRMTSEDEDHGQAIFLGADFGGVGIGS